MIPVEPKLVLVNADSVLAQASLHKRQQAIGSLNEKLNLAEER
jgi:hypothetical protein